MNRLNPIIKKYYDLLEVDIRASDEELNRAFKKMALKFHPDRNRDRIHWAHENMTRLNNAYGMIKSFRFENIAPVKPKSKSTGERPVKRTKTGKPPKQEMKTGYNGFDRRYEIDADVLIKSFIKSREDIKDHLYQYFQYNLYNLGHREKVTNQGIFNKLVFALRQVYHSIKDMETKTHDEELLIHFDTFKNMIFHFYRASECLNIIDSYGNQYDVDAYREYRKGDEYLHMCHKEIFYDRHNRGRFKSSYAYSYLLRSITTLKNTLQIYQRSSWAVETKIKLEYAESLKKYLVLFFTED